MNNGKWMAALAAFIQACDDEQLAFGLSALAHEAAHREGKFEPTSITISVNMPDDWTPEDTNDKPLIVLPGGKK